MFSFNVIYTPGKTNKGADAMSRNPVSKEINLCWSEIMDEDMDTIPAVVLASLHEDQNTDTTTQTQYLPHAALREALKNDESYQQLRTLITNGFPEDITSVPQELRHFVNVKDRLTQTSTGILLMDDRIVVPTKYRKEILKQLHSAHQGVISSKQCSGQTSWEIEKR